jgi:hypothetical protein
VQWLNLPQVFFLPAGTAPFIWFIFLFLPVQILVSSFLLFMEQLSGLALTFNFSKSSAFLSIHLSKINCRCGE